MTEIIGKRERKRLIRWHNNKIFWLELEIIRIESLKQMRDTHLQSLKELEAQEIAEKTFKKKKPPLK